MSKIGRKPIDIKGVQVEIKGKEIHFKGPSDSGIHVLPDILDAQVVDDQLKIICNTISRENNRWWGMHRALLANKIKGATQGFEQKIIITGLGYKGVLSGNNINFSLGFSHKINFPIPEGITIQIDKSGQILTIKGSNKDLVGLVSSKIRSLRPPEPYKGTGIRLEEEVIRRKAGKAKV